MNLDDVIRELASRIRERGNVNVFTQPVVTNPDGSKSTVDSRSYGFDGAEVLLPSVTADGRHLQSDDDIVGEYEKTGRHLGKFADVEAANRYAEQLHQDYAAGRFDRNGVGQALAMLLSALGAR